MDKDKNKAKRPQPKLKPMDLQRFYGAELEATMEMRREMRSDENFAEGDMYGSESGVVMDERYQRADSKINFARSAVSLVCGMWAGTASEAKVVPGTGGDGEEGEMAQADAMIKDLIIRSHEKKGNARYHIRQAVRQAVTIGISWLQDFHYEKVDTDGVSRTVIQKTHEDWESCVWDSSFRQPDFSDGRYFFHHRFLDCDVAKMMYPDNKGEEIEKMKRRWTPYKNPIDEWRSWLGRYSHDSDGIANRRGNNNTGGNDEWHGFYSGVRNATGLSSVQGEREGVWVVRAWWREMQKVEMKDGGKKMAEYVFYQDFLTGGDGGMSDWVPLGKAKSWFWMPFTPIIYQREPKMGAPRGIVYDMKEPTLKINASIAQMLNAGTAQRLMIEEGALTPMFADMPNATVEQKMDRLSKAMNRLDQMIFLDDGALSGGKIKVEENANRFSQAGSLVNTLLPIFQNMVSAVNPSSLGVKGNADSGVAIGRMQQQTVTSMQDFIDNVNMAVVNSGKKALILVEYFDNMDDWYASEDWMRNHKLISPKDILKKGGFDDERYSLNALPAQYHVVPSAVFSTESERFITYLSEVSKTNPAIGTALIPMMIEQMNIPGASAYSQKVALMLKQQGVAVPDEFLAPEDKKAAEEAAQASGQMQQKQMQMEEATAGANINKAEADAELKRRQAENVQADTAQKMTATAAMHAGAGQEDATRAAADKLVELVQQVAGENKRLLEENEHYAMQQAGMAQGGGAPPPVGAPPTGAPPPGGPPPDGVPPDGVA